MERKDLAVWRVDMGYDYESRREMVEDFKEKWNRRLAGVSGETMDMVEQVDLAEDNRNLLAKLPEKALQIMEEGNMSPSRMMEENYGELVRLYVPEKRIEEYYAVIDRLYKADSYKEIYKTGIYGGWKYAALVRMAFRLLFDYKVLEFYGGDLVAYVRKELPDQLLDFRSHTNLYSMRYASELIAAAIDSREADMLRAAGDMLGEGEQAIELDRDFLVGIMKSSDESLYRLAGRLLLAAGTQDGIREMVCYAADAGTVQAFAYIFRCICENNLFRFGSVRMRLMEWLGIWDSKGIDLFVKKYTQQMQEALTDKGRAAEFAYSSDRALIYIGLWALEKHDRKKTAELLQEFQQDGTKSQLMVMAYFNVRQWPEPVCRFMAEQVLHTREEPLDLELAAAYWSTYCLDWKKYREYAAGRQKDSAFIYHRVPWQYFFGTEEEIQKKVGFLRGLLEKMQGKDVGYEPCVFPWHSAGISVSGIMKQLCLLAHMSGDEELTDYVLGHSNEIKKSAREGSRGDYMELLLQDASRKKRVDKLVGLLADKESDTRKVAASLLKGCTLADSHYEILEGYLRLKNGETRRCAIELLGKQEGAKLLCSVDRLLASGNGKMREGALDLIMEAMKEGNIDSQQKERLRQMAFRVKEPKENEKILLCQIMEKAGEEGQGGKENAVQGKENAAQTQEKSEETEGIVQEQERQRGTKDKAQMEEKRKGTGDAVHTQEKQQGTGDAVHAQEKQQGTGDAVHAQEKQQGTGDVVHAQEKQKGTGDIAQEQERTMGTESAVQVHERGGGTGGTAQVRKRYGLYREDARIVFPQQRANREKVISYFDIERGRIDGILEKLADLIKENADRSYRAGNENGNGEEVKLGSYLEEGGSITYHGEYPFRDLWSRFYEEEIRDIRLLTLLRLCLECSRDVRQVEEQETFGQWKQKLFGVTVGSYRLAEHIRPEKHALRKALEALGGMYGTGELGETGMEVFRWILEDMPPEEMWYREIRGRWTAFVEFGFMGYIRQAMEKNREPGQFIPRFYLYVQMDEKYKFHESRNERYYRHSSNEDLLDIGDYVRAYSFGAIDEDVVYKRIFGTWGLEYALEWLGYFAHGTRDAGKPFWRINFNAETGTEEKGFLGAGHHVYTRLTGRMLEEELKRGEMPTDFSDNIRGISCIYGMEYFVGILKALGEEKLDRDGRYGNGKRECLSHLLAVCVPKPEEDGERLKELVKDRETGKPVIKDRRLIEAGMYAPQWLEVLEEYFGIPGFQSGCCYFIAHMAEWFSEGKKAMIARYTPLSSEELWKGAFDCQWFRQVYGTLGEERFGWLYDAAKYISDGSKHVRARKYADAALGRVTAEELEVKIAEKRNKDLLMSYGLIPFRDKADMLRRYEFLQRFLKEGKKYGSMRRASEADAVKMALRNMASAAGYADTMRLTLAMESETVKAYGKYMEWHEVEDVRVKIEISEAGLPSVACEKGGKALKAVPARLKKQEWMASLLDTYRKLKEQTRRCIRMFEQAMKEREKFSYGELLELSGNPVAAPVIRGLVFIVAESGRADLAGIMDRKVPEGKVHELSDEKMAGDLAEVAAERVNGQAAGKIAGQTAAGMAGQGADGIISGMGGKRSGYFTDKGLLGADGELIAVEADTALLVAHPLELFREGTLEAYQRGCYAAITSEIVKKQPFKQLFREFYLKLEEESEQKQSYMFAGYQVEPAKALACLKGQGWVADVEEGIQKICYGENIIAGIRVLSDWITVEDLMAPSIDRIDFYDRKNHKEMCIQDVPEVVYSEIMRDVDLAVSVASAGSVDPETCRSAIEMRKVIAEYNLALFGLENVEFVQNHAVIHGKRADYTVHMGSGVVHRKGGPQIYIKAVPAQRRGRIFLPFVDEDPKTAEILSEIILFARDNKIRDPEILKQIV